MRKRGGGRASEKTNYRLCCLLRARRYRPGARCCRAANQRDELAPSHSITSSARASSDGGTVEAERLRGLEIDHQLVLGRRLHRQVGGLLALEDAIDVACRLSVLIDSDRPIGDQATASDDSSGTDRPRAAGAGPRASTIRSRCGTPTSSPSRSSRRWRARTKAGRRVRSRPRRAC